MNKKFLHNAVLAFALSAGILTASNVDAAKPITIQEQGSFTVGGKTIKHSGTFSKNFLRKDFN